MKIGILGAGNIAGTMAHTIHLLRENGHPELELYAVGARDKETLSGMIEAYEK